jgi:hypothetical protein
MMFDVTLIQQTVKKQPTAVGEGPATKHKPELVGGENGLGIRISDVEHLALGDEGELRVWWIWQIGPSDRGGRVGRSGTWRRSFCG